MKILMVSEFMPYGFMGELAQHEITLCNQMVVLDHSMGVLGNGSFVAPSICESSCFTGALEVCRK